MRSALAGIALLSSNTLSQAATSKIIYATPGNYTWTCPAGVSSITVECWGGGGGGGGCGAAYTGAGGGAGGSYVEYTYSVTPGTIYNLTVGAGGTGGAEGAAGTGTSGGTGGSSYFGNSTAGSSSGASVLAVGGPGGTADNTAGTSGSNYHTSSGGNASAETSGNLPASGTTYDYAGTSGGTGPGTSKGAGAGGAGAALAGSSGGGAGGTGAGSQGNGSTGSAPGGGGGGGDEGSTPTYNSSNGNGGAGGAGMVSIATSVVSPFTPGDIVVEQLGDGDETLANTGNTMFMDEFTTSGTQLQGIKITDSGASALIDSGTASSAGGMTLSTNGQLLCIPGYNTGQPYSSSLTGSSSTAVPRGIGTVSSAGSYSLAATSSSAFNANNFRGAASDGNNNFWGSGNTGSGGIYYFGNASTAADLVNSNLICLNIFGGNIWYDTQKSPFYGIWQYSGTPTTSQSTLGTQVIPLTSSDAPYNFAVNSSGTVIYYADDGSASGESSANAGIHKWTKSGSTWSSQYILLSGTVVYGLAVDWTTAQPTVYATTGSGASGNSLIMVQDTGSGATATTLATAATNTIFRNVEFAPVTPAAANNSPSYSSALTLSCTTVPGATYSWIGPGSFSSSSQNPTVTSNASSANNGTYTVTVSWDGGIYVSTASTTVTVSKATTSVAVNSSENPSGYKDSVYFTATLPSAATGNVIFLTNSVPLSTNALSSGLANSASTTLLPRGTQTITAEFDGDINYIGSTNSISQTVTNHPPAASVMTAYRTAGTVLKVALSDMATNWSDVDGDTVELTGVNPTTTNSQTLFMLNVTTNSGSFVIGNYSYVGYTNGPDVADQFSCSIADGYGGTNIGYVNIVIVGSVSGQATGLISPGGSGVTVNFAGLPGYNYSVQRSTNLMSGSGWVTIWTTNAPAGGLFNYTDSFSGLGGVPSSAYYRLSWQP